jgi:antitoxin (DNA-binding transcriptional repressor) of toxin-antitoxin stability system
MKTVAVSEMKTHLYSLLKEVKSGQEIAISFGKKKEMIAVIIPYDTYRKSKKRELGTLKGKVTVEFTADYAMTDAELL